MLDNSSPLVDNSDLGDARLPYLD